jgi:hypothetical protein
MHSCGSFSVCSYNTTTLHVRRYLHLAPIFFTKIFLKQCTILVCKVLKTTSGLLSFHVHFRVVKSYRSKALSPQSCYEQCQGCRNARNKNYYSKTIEIKATYLSIKLDSHQLQGGQDRNSHRVGLHFFSIKWLSGQPFG